MSNIRALLSTLVILIAGSVALAGEPAPVVAAPQACNGGACGCEANHCGREKLRHFWRWLTYCPTKSCEPCCHHQCLPACPPLYAFFLDHCRDCGGGCARAPEPACEECCTQCHWFPLYHKMHDAHLERQTNPEPVCEKPACHHNWLPLYHRWMDGNGE